MKMQSAIFAATGVVLVAIAIGIASDLGTP